MPELAPGVPTRIIPGIDRRAFLHAGAVTAGALALGPARWSWWTRAVPPDTRLAWWREARFGLFIHWGLYSILEGAWGGGTDYAEWIRNNAHIPLAEYDKLVGRFNPVRFDADRCVAAAKNAGARYLTITTKHHDGFCLFDSKQTDFCIRSTPFKRDVMREIAGACRAQGVVPCWYHSIMDWHHPDYLPRRDWEAETRPVNGARFSRYVDYLHKQVGELLGNYGDIGVMWFDGNWEGTWTHELGQALYDRCRALQPSVIVNNRVEGWSPTPIRDHLGDFGTPEQQVPATGLPGVDWESCITMNDNWGYNREDHHFKTVPQLIGLLTETASKGGNLLLNVGPKPDGTFPDESVEALEGIGRWMRVNGEAIYGTTASRFSGTPFRSTTKGSRRYLFLTDWTNEPILLPGLHQRPAAVRLLADPNRPITAENTEAGVRLTIPGAAPDSICSVVAVDLPAGASAGE